MLLPGSAPTEFISVKKEASGRSRWIAYSSSAFRDRDGEIVTQAALEADVERMDATKEFGPLLWWHVPGAVIGQCDFSAMHGAIRIESGTFINEPIAEAVKAHAGELGVSIGFDFYKRLRDADGTLHGVIVKERSFLPFGSRSNLLTAIGAITKEHDMKKLKIEKLKELVGDDEVVTEVIAGAEAAELAADAKGIARKEVADPDEADETEDDEAGDEETSEKKDVKTPRAKAAKPATLASVTVEEFAGMLGAGMKEFANGVIEATKLTIAEALKESATKEAKTSAQMAGLLADYDTRIKSLEGELPPVVKARGVAGEPGDVTAALLEAAGLSETTKEQAPQAGGELFKLLFPHIK